MNKPHMLVSPDIWSQLSWFAAEGYHPTAFSSRPYSILYMSDWFGESVSSGGFFR